ncbi:hypothetical protein [Nocardia sp. NPDC005366]|uniref:hypothetical protein n=1 Tax=Nocardia sp. NPDC005366 TaxID=3156878 RepID=UPI0033B0AA1D
MGDHDGPATNPVALPGIPNPVPAQGTLDATAIATVTTAQQNAAAAQTRVSAGDAELDDLGAGTDPAFVQTIEHFEGMTHEQMYQAVHGPGGMDAAGLRTLQRTWFASYSDLANLSTFNAMGLARIFGNGLWDGASGAAAQAASTRLSAAANQIGRVFDSVADRLDALSWSAEAVRAAVQPPPAAAPPLNPDNQVESILPGLINPEYDDQTRTAQEQARQAVIRALNSAYTPVFPPAGTDVPAYTSVPHIGGTDTTAGTNTNPGTSALGSGNQFGPNAGAGQQNPEGAAPTQESPSGIQSPAASSANESATVPSGLDLPDGLSGTGQNTTPSTATTPAGVGTAPTSPTSPTLGLNGSGHGSGNNPGSGTPGSGTPGSGTPGSGTPGSPGLGRSVTNSPLPGATANSATSASAANNRGATRTPMGSMGPGAGTRGKKDDDDNTHQSPDYLRQVYSDWTQGLDSPAGVIGADASDFGREPHNPTTAFTNPAAAYTDSPASPARPQSPSAAHPRHEPQARPEVPAPPQRPPARPTLPQATTPAVVNPAATYPATTHPHQPPAPASDDSAFRGHVEPTARPGDAHGEANPQSTFAGAATLPADIGPGGDGGNPGERPAAEPVTGNDPQIGETSEGDSAGEQVVTITGSGPFAGGGPGSGDDLTTRITTTTSTDRASDDEAGRAR